MSLYSFVYIILFSTTFAFNFILFLLSNFTITLINPEKPNEANWGCVVVQEQQSGDVDYYRIRR